MSVAMQRVSFAADIMPGYTFSVSAGRFRSSSTGKFVSRANITSLMTTYVNDGEARLGELTNAYAEGKMDASTWATSMRDEMRRLTLAAESLGGGGIDQLLKSPRQLGRAGGELANRYARISANAQQFANGEISQAQLLARINSMVGESQAHFFKAERDSAKPQEPGGVLIERRILSSSEHCGSCIDLYGQGWQEIGVLPVPADGSTECRGADKCRLERKEVDRADLAAWIGTKR